MLPLLLEGSLQAQTLIPLATSIVFGLMASTVRVLSGSARSFTPSRLRSSALRIGLAELCGPNPGSGSALVAFGIEHGNLLAYEVSEHLRSRNEHGNADPWPIFEATPKDPGSLSTTAQEYVGDTFSRLWESLKPERKTLLKLLSWFELTGDQAKRSHQETERDATCIDASDKDIIANPYRVLELDADSVEPVRLGSINRGAFPDPIVFDVPPLPDSQVRLQLFAMAYNIGNFLRRLALPPRVGHWTLTTLREKLIKIGAKLVRHSKYVTFQLAEVAVPRRLFVAILKRIQRLRAMPCMAPS